MTENTSAIPAPPAVGTELTLRVDTLAHGGAGVARVDGRVLFVDGALPGEEVVAKVTKSKARYLTASTAQVLQASPARRAPDCPHEAEGCGGCGWRYVEAEPGLGLKAETAAREMAKVAREVSWPAPVLLPVAQHDGVRTRVRLHVTEGRIGLFAEGSRRVVAIPQCLSLDPRLLVVAQALQRALSGQDDAYGEVAVDLDGRGQVVISWRGRVGAALWTRLVDLVERRVFSGVRVEGRGGGVRDHGDLWLVDQVALPELKTAVHRFAGTFGQATPAGNAHLQAEVAQWVQGEKATRVFDLYAGSGNFSLVLAAFAQEVIAVEVVQDALKGLRRGATAAGYAHLQVVPWDLSQGIPERAELGREDCVILDPPRQGAREIMGDLRRYAPRSILYVSCEPTTLARDVAALGGDYAVARLAMVDLFPRTPHLESVAWLRRVDP